MSTPPPVPQKKGMSALGMLGCGCLSLFIIAFLGAGILTAVFLPQLKEFAADPSKAAIWALEMNPDIEVLSKDETKREITFKTKSTGKTTTLNYDDLKEGKITLTNDQGEEYNVDASKAAQEGIVMKGPEGQTVIGGDISATAAPTWVPLYPGLTTTTGGMKTENAEGINGVSSGITPDSPEKVKAQLEAALTAAGFTIVTQSSTNEAATTSTLSATKAEGDLSVTYVITGAGNQTSVMTQYKGPKP